MDNELTWIPLRTGADQQTLDWLVEWSRYDEDIVMHLVSMPFMETIEFLEVETLSRLQELSQNNPAGLERVLSHPTFEDGITDELVIHVTLLYLEETNPEIADAINGLPWVQDGMTYVPPSDLGAANPDPKEHELVNLAELIEVGTRAPEVLLALASKPWVRDSLSTVETSALGPLFNLTSSYPQVAVQLLNMPFLDSIDSYDSEILWTLAELEQSTGVSPGEFLSDPALAGGISNDNLSIVQLLEVELREPERYASIEGLSWIQDGIDVSESFPVTVLTELALDTDAVFTAVMEKNWVRDGLTREEATSDLST